ncbi:hypothetical protein COCNU_05G002910 [Cocos nucifera]|uniref:Uncharacterized protein n=1 Tax=Cocos nucifera TaxID=13894 RepID=A0A8K0I7R2_COCNU|nr:hypothetical protein COCNU_05G002910 [Cocos nucifera]
MEWWDRVAFPMRRVWIGVTTRLGLRKTGLGSLRKEVSTCEYEDVHVMWELLRRTDAEVARMRPGRRRRRRGRHVWDVFGWARRAAPCNYCRGF